MTEVEYATLNNLERVVADWLLKNNIIFQTQTPMFGGSLEVGGATVDFILSERNIALRVMGGYWHRGLEMNARDILGKEKLTEAGYIVIDIWEKNLTPDKVNYTMSQAIIGQEIPS